MLKFKTYIPESIVDPLRDSISPEIFFEPKSDNPKLKPKVIETIKSGLKDIEKLAPIKDYLLIGSTLTRRWAEDSDLDVTVLLDVPDAELNDYRKKAAKLNGTLVPGAKHPVNYFLTSDRKDFDRKSSLADGEFDIKKNEFKRKPVFKAFSVKKYWTDFQKAAGEIDSGKSELKKDLVDYEQLKGMSKTEVKFLRKQVLDKAEQDAKDLVDLYEKIKQDRRDAFDRPLTPEDIKKYGEKNRLPENVVYKLLEKHHYMDFLHRIEEILGDDKELTPAEADELAKLVLSDD